MHQQISSDGCRAADLPEDFCERVGTEAYNVDAYEWSRPEAHAQIGDGAIASACTSANAALERERMLGSDIRTNLQMLRNSPSEDLRIHIATQLGRALHTIQDNCAHRGMPNVQHAWWSLADSCTGSKSSPDVQPEAEDCALGETAAIFDAFTREMSTAGVAPGALDDVPEGWTHWPARGDVCAFLREAATWDGVDHRWDNDLEVPWLRDQLTNALTVDDSSVGDTCAAQVSIIPLHSDAVVDTTNAPPWCLEVSVLCAGTGGKDDDAREVRPPWEPAPAAASSGCSVDNRDSWLLALLGLAALERRRRA